MFASQLGDLNNEACAGIVAMPEYFRTLLGKRPYGTESLHEREVEAFFELITEMEAPLQARLIEYLKSKRDAGVSIIGPQSSSTKLRIPIISFVAKGRASSAIARSLHMANIACSHGHMGSYRFVQGLRIQPAQGVVRISLAHYNTLEEVELLIQALETILVE